MALCRRDARTNSRDPRRRARDAASAGVTKTAGRADEAIPERDTGAGGQLAREWADAVYEKGETRSFYNDFFKIFGKRRRDVPQYEEHVQRLDNRSVFIDLFRPLVLLVERDRAAVPRRPADNPRQAMMRKVRASSHGNRRDDHFVTSTPRVSNASLVEHRREARRRVGERRAPAIVRLFKDSSLWKTRSRSSGSTHREGHDLVRSMLYWLRRVHMSLSTYLSFDGNVPRRRVELPTGYCFA